MHEFGLWLGGVIDGVKMRSQMHNVFSPSLSVYVSSGGDMLTESVCFPGLAGLSLVWKKEEK